MNNAVVAGRIAGGFRPCALAEIDHRHFSVWDRSAGGIDDGSEDAAVNRLAECLCGRKGEKAEKCDQKDIAPHLILARLQTALTSYRATQAGAELYATNGNESHIRRRRKRLMRKRA